MQPAKAAIAVPGSFAGKPAATQVAASGVHQLLSKVVAASEHSVTPATRQASGSAAVAAARSALAAYKTPPPNAFLNGFCETENDFYCEDFV